jgi:hypothetical protein
MARKPKRQRDYKAEYARRTAKLAPGPSPERQRARGHKPKEHVERARRTRRKFGVSPSTLTKLRARVVDHILAQLAAAGTAQPVKPATVRRGIKALNGNMLRFVLATEMHGETIKAGASIQGDGPEHEEVAARFSEYFESLVDLWQDGDVQMPAELSPDDWNPFWYH